MSESLRLIEPIPIEDDFISGLWPEIEDLGFGARLTYYATQWCHESRETVHVVKRRIVAPREVLQRAHPIVRAYLCRRKPLHLVR